MHSLNSLSLEFLEITGRKQTDDSSQKFGLNSEDISAVESNLNLAQMYFKYCPFKGQDFFALAN